MKKIKLLWFGLLIVFLCVNAFAQSGPPPIPEWFPLLEDFGFYYSFADLDNYTPVAYTNVSLWGGEVLVLDTTNTTPAFLEFNVVEADNHTNLSFPVGTITIIFSPNWASADTNQNGAGPGFPADFFFAGDPTTNAPEGSFRIYANAGGTNIYFGGVTNGVVTNYVSAPISWASNSWHAVDCEYSPSNSYIYLDGVLAGTGAGVSILPPTNTWTNGLFLGSDPGGFEQMRGASWEIDDWNIQFAGGYFGTNYWDETLTFIENWQDTNGGSGGGFDMMMGGGLGSLNPTGPTNDYTGPQVYLTNESVAPVSGQGLVFSFTIDGGSNGWEYDVFQATNVVMHNITNANWLWLGQGTNSGSYQVTNQPSAGAFYVLGTPLMASDGSGLTVAYEALVHSTSSDGFGTPNAWYLGEGINPQTSGVGTQDPDGDGLLNWQEYLYGSNPQVSEGFVVWVSEPNGTSGIP